MRHFAEQSFQARSWKHSNRLLIETEHNGLGRNARFVITRLEGDPQTLYGTEPARATIGTVRLKRLKIGAVVLRNTRRVRLYLSTHYAYRDLLSTVAARLRPG